MCIHVCIYVGGENIKRGVLIMNQCMKERVLGNCKLTDKNILVKSKEKQFNISSLFVYAEEIYNPHSRLDNAKA